MNTKNILLSLGLLLLCSAVSAATNNPPVPDEPPPTTCSTGRPNDSCGLEVPRGYRLRCPDLHPNTLVPVTRYLCQPPADPVIPHIVCEQSPDSLSCEGFPSGAENLVFQWQLDLLTETVITPWGDQNRFVDIDCSTPWSGRITVQVINQNSGASSSKSFQVACLGAR